jgi:hypothetical protein
MDNTILMTIVGEGFRGDFHFCLSIFLLLPNFLPEACITFIMRNKRMLFSNTFFKNLSFSVVFPTDFWTL